MSRFIARRFVAMVPLLILVSIIAFSLVLLLPGDPALAILGEERANADNRSAYFALRQEMGLDDPIPDQVFPRGGGGRKRRLRHVDPQQDVDQRDDRQP